MFNLFNNKETLPRGVRKLITPRQAFTKKTKATFLAVFDAAHPEARASSFTKTAKAFVAGGALVSILAGVSAYADTANVAADSPLYSFKRLGESVQLTIAPKAQKAQLQATFATRRAVEIGDLETRKPSSTLIVGLTTDFKTDIDTSLDDAKDADLQDGQLNKFCNKVFAAIATSSVDLRVNFNAAVFNGRGKVSAKSGAQIIGKFVKQCGGDVSASTTPENASGTSAASSSFHFPFPFPFTMPTSTAPTSTHERGDGGGRFTPPPKLPHFTATSTIVVSSSIRLDLNDSTSSKEQGSANIQGIWKKLFDRRQE